MPVNQYTPGINYPAGFQVANPFPLDAYLGPYPGGTTTDARNFANNTISPVNRYQGMQVILLAPDGGQTRAYKYWYRGGTGNTDLVEFSSEGGGGIVGDYVTTFNGRTGAVQGVSAAVPGDGIAVSAATGSVTITNIGVTYISAGSFISVSGNTGTVTVTNLGVHSFNGKTGAVTGASLGANTFTELNTFNAGISASGATLGTLIVNSGATVGGRLDVGGILDVTGNILTSGQIIGTFGKLHSIGSQIYGGLDLPDGLSASGGITFNSRANFVAGLSAAGATLGTLTVNSGTTVSGRLDVGGILDVVSGVTLESTLDVVGAARFAGGLSAASIYASTGSTFGSTVQVNGGFSAGSTSTFGGLATFNGGLSAAGGATLSGKINVGQLDVSGALTVSGPLTSFSTIIAPFLGSSGNATILGGVSASNFYASQGSTFAGPVAFLSGLTASGITATRVDTGTLATTGLATLNSLSVTNNATIGGTLDVYGNLYVQGTLTTVNETQLLIQDKFLVLGSTLNSSSLADGAGVYVGATVGANAFAGICYSHSGNQWSSSHAFNVPANTSYRIGGVTAIAGTFLGPSIAGSSLTSVGILTNGVWNASVIGLTWGGTNKNLASSSQGGVAYRDPTGIDITSAGTDGQYLRSNGSGAPTWASFSALTGLTADSVNITNTETTNGTYFMTFVDASASGTRIMRADSGITYNPFTNTISCTQIEAIVDGGTW